MLFQPTTVFTFEDDLLAIPLAVANQHAPLLISSVRGRMYVVTAEEQRPVLPLTPLEALTEVRLEMNIKIENHNGTIITTGIFTFIQPKSINTINCS